MLNLRKNSNGSNNDDFITPGTSVDASIFKITEQDARLFEVEENKFIVTEFDVSAVAQYYETDLFEALVKIAEAHNIPGENIEILTESIYDPRKPDAELEKLKEEEEQWQRKYEEFKESAEKYAREGDHSKENIAKNVAANYKNKLAAVKAKIQEYKHKSA